MNTYAFEKVAKVKYGLGTPNKTAEEEALGFINEQLPCINDQLSHNRYLTGTDITIADYIAFAYFENAELADFSLSDFDKVSQWYQQLKNSRVIHLAHHKLEKR